MSILSSLRARLTQERGAFLGLWAVAAAFGTYFCMYAFRKPFAVGTWEGEVELPGVGPLDYKILLIISQIAGYCVSKFLGIKIVSEMPPAKRALAILAFVGIAELALVLFALTPAPWNAVFLFMNGLPLGMIWGLVFSFIEGRRTSDLLGAGLCASFIVASGFVKSVGRILLEHVPEPWMPAVTGAVFLVPLGLFVAMLALVPPPNEEDERERTRREPMDAAARSAFLREHGPGIGLLVVGYILLTAYRDFRDNFAREIWDSLGYADTPEILTTAELPVAAGSLVAVALLFAVRNNRWALGLIHGAMAAGAGLVVGSTLLYQMGMLAPATWMITVGLGLYIGYVPFNCVLFDRLLAATRSVGTAAFLIYVSDAFGYLGSVFLMLYRDLGQASLSWLEFFTTLSLIAPIIWGVSFLAAWFWFRGRFPDVEEATAGASS